MAREVIAQVDSIWQGSLAGNGGSQVCHVVWLGEDEPAGAGPSRVLLFTSPEGSPPADNNTRRGNYYAVIALRNVTRDLPHGTTLRLGDAVIRICNSVASNLNSPSVFEAELLEEGLVEPGAPVVALE